MNSTTANVEVNAPGNAVNKANWLGLSPAGWALNVLAWTIWGGIIGAAAYFRYVRFEPGFPWWPNFLESVFGWLPWTMALPLILWLSRRFRIDRVSAVKNFLIQLGMSIILGLALMYLYVVIGSAVYSTIYHSSFVEAWNGFGMPDFIYQRLFLAVAVYWVIIGGEHALNFQRLSTARQLRAAELQGQLAETQLLALRYQLQPHFLFNTLHSVVSLVQQDKKDESIEMLEGLSRLLRHTFEHIRGHESTLKDELAFVADYLKNEQVRFADRLNIEYHVTDEARACYVPNFVLQPLVENALRHGIEKRTGSGTITITAEIVTGPTANSDNGSQKTLLLSVMDDGEGPTGLHETGGGVGLRATRARLEKLYPGESSLKLTEAGGRGAAAEIIIPYHTTPIEFGSARESNEKNQSADS